MNSKERKRVRERGREMESKKNGRQDTESNEGV